MTKLENKQVFWFRFDDVGYVEAPVVFKDSLGWRARLGAVERDGALLFSGEPRSDDELIALTIIVGEFTSAGAGIEFIRQLSFMVIDRNLSFDGYGRFNTPYEDIVSEKRSVQILENPVDPKSAATVISNLLIQLEDPSRSWRQHNFGVRESNIPIRADVVPLPIYDQQRSVRSDSAAVLDDDRPLVVLRSPQAPRQRVPVAVLQPVAQDDAYDLEADDAEAVADDDEEFGVAPFMSVDQSYDEASENADDDFYDDVTGMDENGGGAVAPGPETYPRRPAGVLKSNDAFILSPIASNLVADGPFKLRVEEFDNKSQPDTPNYHRSFQVLPVLRPGANNDRLKKSLIEIFKADDLKASALR